MIIQSLLQTGLFLQVITSGRLESLVAGVVGLISIIIGRSAILRSSRPMAMAALVGGVIAIILSILRLARATGGFGTGSGRLGAIVAIVVGVIGVILAMKALARAKMKSGKG